MQIHPLKMFNSLKGEGMCSKEKNRQSSMRMRSRSAERTIKNWKYRLEKVIKRVNRG